jgi:hypothetical protein
MRRRLKLSDSYRFPSFKPKQTVTGVFGDPHARVVSLIRQGKKLSAVSVGPFIGHSMIVRSKGSATFPAATPVSTSIWRFDASSAKGAGK